ncbi:HEAT repeat domain-containing protein [Planctomycetota bacterium]
MKNVSIPLAGAMGLPTIVPSRVLGRGIGSVAPNDKDWDRWLGPAPWRPYNAILSPPLSVESWHHWRDYSGGQIADWGAHHFDIVQWALDRDSSGPVNIIPPNGKGITSYTFMYEGGVALVLEPGDSGTITSLLPTLTPLIQVQRITSFAELGEENVRGEVVNAADSDHADVRIAALKALAALSDEHTVEDLAGMAAVRKGVEKSSARESLYRLKGEDIDQTIVKLISTAPAKEKVELIGSVAARTIVMARPILFDMTGHADQKVRLESIEVLGEICTFEDVSKMIDVLLQAQSDSERAATVKALAALILKGPEGGANSRLILERFKTTDDNKVRSSFIQVLGKVGEEESLPLLVEVYENKTGTLQTDAVRALADWPTAKPMDYLLNIVRTPENNTRKILALRGFIRHIGIADDLSDVEKTNMYKMAMALATNVSEKRMVIAGIGQLKTPEAMGMAERSLQDPILSAEAEVAFLKIAASIGRNDREKTLDVLQGSLHRTKRPENHKKAFSLIRNLYR